MVLAIWYIEDHIFKRFLIVGAVYTFSGSVKYLFYMLGISFDKSPIYDFITLILLIYSLKIYVQLFLERPDEGKM